QPAIRYARDGFPVSPIIARLWELGRLKLGDQPGFAECFLPEGRAPRAGEVFGSLGHAETLDAIAGAGGAAFYRGDPPERRAANPGFPSVFSRRGGHREREKCFAASGMPRRWKPLPIRRARPSTVASSLSGWWPTPKLTAVP